MKLSFRQWGTALAVGLPTLAILGYAVWATDTHPEWHSARALFWGSQILQIVALVVAVGYFIRKAGRKPPASRN